MGPRAGSTRRGVELLTLWMQEGDNERWAAVERIHALVNDPNEPAPEDIVVGLLNLSMFLAILVAKAQITDSTGIDLLEVAREVVRKLSLELPE
jgi:hypothetical protein